MLREPQVMGVRRFSAANQTGVLGNRFDVFSPVATSGVPELMSSVPSTGSGVPFRSIGSVLLLHLQQLLLQ